MTRIRMTAIEERAEAATKLPALMVNLAKVRQSVETALSEWRTSGFFREYTDHSFHHVIDMLNTAEWIIPEQTKEIMTKADWLMLVLSIYFHDLGLLITKNEYDNRKQNTDFQDFLNVPLLSSEKHREYEARIAQMSSEEADRLQYQEFVRLTHGKRIRNWINQTEQQNETVTAGIISDLLGDLDETFRRDLGRVCESHTSANFDDTSIFKVSQPYGGDEETVNLQYICVILRTVDLLQITNKRTPSVLFQIINPSNPVSQIEWKKHGAVRNVRPRPARDREGNVTTDVLADTIEVHATFNDPDGFFGLTRYLNYAERELFSSYKTIQRSAKDNLRPYKFPWRSIDVSNIDTNGFMTDSFEFALDQTKILDLLTGHTLYNDSDVVLRELTQNALDAVRLQGQIELARESDYKGRVDIEWNSSQRSLTVTDNGTGMSQDMVVNHLLKVGSSRYQDEKFKEIYPDFHSISRFGIGVLSAFMISDEIEITTCHPDDEKARQIALRSVHGKYLIKLINKDTERDCLPNHPHGTSIKLNLRPTADMGNILAIAQRWIMFPKCEVNLRVDDRAFKIGFESPAHAVKNYIDHSLSKSRYKIEYKVIEVERGGVTIAFAIAKDTLFNDWTFVDVYRHDFEDDEQRVPTCICIEGVSVEQITPGFNGIGILAAVNAVGKSAPKTNVARTSLEDTVERHDMLKAVYSVYSEFIAGEIIRIAREDGVSLTRAVGMAPYLIAPLTSSRVPVAKISLMDEAVSTVPMILVEDVDKRESISLERLMEIGSFFTIDSPLRRSADQLIKEAPGNVTSSQLLVFLGNQNSGDLPEVRLSNFGFMGWIDRKIADNFEICEISVSKEERELKLKWRAIGSRSAWISGTSVEAEIAVHDFKFVIAMREFRERLRGRIHSQDIFVPREMLITIGLDDQAGFMSNRNTHLTPDTDIARYLSAMYSSDDIDDKKRLAVCLMFLEYIKIGARTWNGIDQSDVDRIFASEYFSRFSAYIGGVEEMVTAIQSSPSEIFDASAWDKRNSIWSALE